MLSSLLNRGAVSLTILSLFTSTVVGEVFEKLREVPEGKSAFDHDQETR